MPDTRPTPGSIESRSAPEGLSVQGRRLRGHIPYNVESRDLGGWRERIAPGALAGADLSDLVCRVDHGGLPIGRFPGTLHTESRSDGFHWDVDLPESRADIREAVERGDLRATSWQMIVGKDSWAGELRTIEEITSLRDVTLATTAAYPSATAEYRNLPEPAPAPEPTPVPTPTPEANMPEAPPTGGGLRLEDRTGDQLPSVESRVMDAMAAVPRGESRTLQLASAGPVEPTDLSLYLWDQLRPMSVVLRSGVHVVDTVRQSVKWPTLIGDILAEWTTESDPISESEPDFAQFELTPKSIKALVRGSDEAFSDSNPDLLQIVQANLQVILALLLDRECIDGGSTNGFDGLLRTTGRQTLAIDGPLANYDWYERAEGLLAEKHVPGPYAVIMHPRVDTALSTVKEWTGAESNVNLPRPSDMPAPYISSQVPLDVTVPAAPTSSVLVYAPAQIVLARRLDVTIEIDRSRAFETDEVLVRGKLRACIGTPHPEAIVEVTGVDSPAIV